MERTLISWNIPNWITIGLMGLSFYWGSAIVKQFIMSRGGTTTAGSGGY